MIRPLAVTLILAAAPAAAFDCHTALILALDASSSIDADEHRLQRQGLADALRSPDIQAAIAPYPGEGVAAMAFEWSSPDQQIEIAAWALLSTPSQIAAFAQAIENGPTLTDHQHTAIGAAVRYASTAFGETPAACDRRVIDISGDGPANAGPAPDLVRRAPSFQDVTINALVIRHPDMDSAQPPDADPLTYYQKRVIHGPGAFVMVANSYRDYAAAIRRKLLRELTPMVAQAERAAK